MLEFVRELYYKYEYLGDWRNADGIIEIIIGAILTQQTKREKVSEIIKNIKIKFDISGYDINLQKEKVKLLYLQEKFFSGINFYKKKYRIIIDVFNWFINEDFNNSPINIRKNLLKIKGIGKETADSILCYGFNMRFLPIDYYTYKVLDYYVFNIGVNKLKKIYPYDKLASYIGLDEFNFKTLHGAFVEEGKKLKNKK